MKIIEGVKLGRRLKELRDEKGWDLPRAAQGFIRSASTLGQIERGEIIKPPETVLSSLAKIYGVSVKSLQDLANEDAGIREAILRASGISNDCIESVLCESYQTTEDSCAQIIHLTEAAKANPKQIKEHAATIKSIARKELGRLT